MQNNKKLTLIVTVFAVVFVFMVMGLAYQFLILSDLQKQLEERNLVLNSYNQLYNDTMQEIQTVQSSSYIERWARSVLEWVTEGETRIIFK